MWLEGLGKLKKSNDIIANRTHDLSASSIVPQPITLPRPPPQRKPLCFIYELHNELEEKAIQDCSLQKLCPQYLCVKTNKAKHGLKNSSV
jgi:hypothetical protein